MSTPQRHPPLMKSHILHPSGGLIWHWRAWRNRRHWRPVIKALRYWLQDWLNQFPKDHRQLVLIGPSAGWTLPHEIIDQFDAFVIFEPDILARQRWKKRLKSRKLRFDFHDVFSTDGLSYLHDTYPAHAILFCNVLGQLSPTDDEAAHTWCREIRRRLHDRHWASYHDWISTTYSPAQFEKSVAFSAGTPLESVIDSFWRESEIEVNDHNTEHLAESVHFYCIPWRLRKNQWHLIQWVSHIAS